MLLYYLFFNAKFQSKFQSSSKFSTSICYVRNVLSCLKSTYLFIPYTHDETAPVVKRLGIHKSDSYILREVIFPLHSYKSQNIMLRKGRETY